MFNSRSINNAMSAEEESSSSFNSLSRPTRPFAVQQTQKNREMSGTIQKNENRTRHYIKEESASPSAAPIQMLRTAKAFSEAMTGSGEKMSNIHLKKVHDALNQYHSKSRKDFETDQEYSDHRAKALDDMEHGSYEYFNSIKGAKPTDSHYSNMLDMLDEIQQAHIEHVDYIHKNNLKLYATGLKENEDKELNQNWDSIRKGTGMIKLPEGEQHEKTNKEVRAMYARLLSRPNGRKLLKQLLAKQDEGDDRSITHEYLNRDNSSLEQQQEKRRNKEHFQTVVKPQLEKSEKELRAIHTNYSKQYNNEDPKKWPEKQRLEYEALREKKDKAYDTYMDYIDETRENYKDIKSEEPARASENAGGKSKYKGKGSKIYLMKGLKDSENLTHDSEGNLIPAPAFITYGHELIHALHNKQGTKDIATDSERYEYGGDLAKWGNREEHQTIAKGVGAELSENELREDHGITFREGHTAKSRQDQVLEQEKQKEKAKQSSHFKRNLALGVIGVGALIGGGFYLYNKYFK